MALATPVVGYCGLSFFSSAWKRLRHLQTNMDTLVAMGAGTAYTYSSVATLAHLSGSHGTLGTGGVYFEPAATIVTFLLVGRYLESRATLRANDAVNGSRNSFTLTSQNSLLSNQPPLND